MWRDTPWASPHEWEALRRGLFSPHADAQRLACARAHAWKLKDLPIPVLLQCTVQLVEAAALARASLEQRRLALAMAVVRLVNCATEGEQRGTFAQSVSQLAARQGLPQWLVAARHDATHGVLPALGVLSLARATCLDWLEAKYWAPQRALFFAEGGGDADQHALFAQLAALVESGELEPVPGPRPRGDTRTAKDVCAQLRPDVARLAAVLAAVPASFPAARWTAALRWLDDAWGGDVAGLMCLRAAELRAPAELRRWCALLVSADFRSEPSRALLLDALRVCLHAPSVDTRALALDVVLPALRALPQAREAAEALLRWAVEGGGGVEDGREIELAAVAQWCDGAVMALAEAQGGGAQAWAEVRLPPGTALGAAARPDVCAGLALAPDGHTEDDDDAGEAAVGCYEGGGADAEEAEEWQRWRVERVAKRVKCLV